MEKVLLTIRLWIQLNNPHYREDCGPWAPDQNRSQHAPTQITLVCTWGSSTQEKTCNSSRRTVKIAISPLCSAGDVWVPLWEPIKMEMPAVDITNSWRICLAHIVLRSTPATKKKGVSIYQNKRIALSFLFFFLFFSFY